MLFYAEDLRRQIIGAVQSTDRFMRKSDPRITSDTKKKFQRATAVLVSDGVLTEEERNEIGKLVDMRNQIAHNIHNLTYDVSRNTYVRGYSEFSDRKYDYESLARLKYFHSELPERMMSRYVSELSMDGILFESAEKTYEAELKTLSRKIRAQVLARQKKSGLLKEELSLSGTEFQSEEMYPGHPANRSRNGNLSDRGIEVCFRLFDIGKRPIVVAYLMYISAAAARHRYKQWIQAGGLARKKVKIAPQFSGRTRIRKSAPKRKR